MKFDIITIFPKIFDSYFAETILARAQKNGLIEIKTHNLRDWTEDNHKSVDDSPYGGPGMVMMVEPIFKAVEALKKSQNPNPKSQENSKEGKTRIILFSAKGKPFTQDDARRLVAEYDQIIMICGRYEGVDERVAQHIADEELSVGNFVLTGGEIPAMILIDSVSRLVPGVLGKKESLDEESFSEKNPPQPSLKGGGNEFSSPPLGGVRGDFEGVYLEYPQYTRPEEFKDWKVPEILLSGDHKKIEEWRKVNAKFKNQNVR